MTRTAVEQAAQYELETFTPSQPHLWAEVLQEARTRFCVFPSFYGNAWAKRAYHQRLAAAALPTEEPPTSSSEQLVQVPGDPEPVADVAGTETPPEPSAPQAGQQKAFVTHANGKTFITAPVDIAGGWQKALTPNPHMLWLQGRLVGAETPNRNGALWTAQDLQLGEPTVAHGPVNWLHESRHVIGAIAEARYIPGTGTPILPLDAPQGAAQTAAETIDPHIVTAASIWRWIYPDEATVIEWAAEKQQLWQSMECISETVICPEDFGGCGRQVSYLDYIHDTDAVCQHMREKSHVRRFADPTFLGTGIIVPPTRPGWADADVTILAQAAQLSEKAYEQLGSPDIPASTFEQMVAQVVRYAQD